MAEEQKPDMESQDVEIEPLSDEALEDVAGGMMCSYAACSNKG